MRYVQGLLVLGMLAGALGTLTSGCWDRADDCTLNAVPCGPLPPDAGTDGGDSGPLPSCIPSLNSTPVADACGVFVSSTGSDTSGKGTQAAPVPDADKAALGKADGKPVYACAGTTPFRRGAHGARGARRSSAGSTARRGSYIGATTKTIVTAGAGEIPVTLAAGSGAKLADLHVLAADVSAMSDGSSSIAVVANGATAELDGCVIEAQGGAAGAAGKGYTSAAKAGTTGLPGTDACMARRTFFGALG